MTAGDCASDETICSVWLDRLSERNSIESFFHVIWLNKTTALRDGSRWSFFKTLKTMAPQNAILAHLLGGGRLTVNKALAMFRTTELRKVVSRLKRAGHDIRSVWRDDVADGRKVRFKEYYLVKQI